MGKAVRNQFVIKAGYHATRCDLFGCVKNIEANETVWFESVYEMLGILEDGLEEDGPQPSTKARTFLETAEGRFMGKSKRTALPQEAGKPTATFVVSVLYRENATWQGSVKWLEEEKEQKFRSLLELIKLMDSTLEDQLQKEQA